METLAVAISHNANKVASSIRAKLTEENKATPVIQESLSGVDTYVTLPAAGYILTKSESAEAMDKARAQLTKLLMDFDYENQMITA